MSWPGAGRLAASGGAAGMQRRGGRWRHAHHANRVPQQRRIPEVLARPAMRRPLTRRRRLLKKAQNLVSPGHVHPVNCVPRQRCASGILFRGGGFTVSRPLRKLIDCALLTAVTGFDLPGVVCQVSSSFGLVPWASTLHRISAASTRGQKTAWGGQLPDVTATTDELGM